MPGTRFTAGTLHLDDDVLIVHVELEGEPERWHVEEFQNAVRETLGDRGPVGLLTTQSSPLFFSADTVDYMDEQSEWFDRIAFVVSSPMVRASVRALQYATRDPRPTLVTESFDEALAWLKGEGRDEALARRGH